MVHGKTYWSIHYTPVGHFLKGFHGETYWAPVGHFVKGFRQLIYHARPRDGGGRPSSTPRQAFVYSSTGLRLLAYRPTVADGPLAGPRQRQTRNRNRTGRHSTLNVFFYHSKHTARVSWVSWVSWQVDRLLRQTAESADVTMPTISIDRFVSALLEGL